MRFSVPLDARKIVRKVKKKWLWLVPYTATIADWEVLTEFRFYYDDRFPNTFVLVPAGWETDLASVPGFLGFIVQKDGDFSQAAVTHDWAYRNRGDVIYIEQPDGKIVKGLGLTREEQDKVFLHGMEILGTSLPIRFIMWRAVRRFGWISYPKKP